MFTLTPTTSNIFQGQLLLGISFIVAMKSTLGATIQNASRLFLGGAIATCYCLLIIHLCPRTVYFGVGATTVLVLLIVYTDLPVTVRRFTIVPTCIVLLQWFTKPHINGWFVLQIWASLCLGASLAVLVTSLPMPMVPTAYRELTMRMRFLARQTRRETTAILLLISEYHNQHLGTHYERNSDHGIEMERSASVALADEEREQLSHSFENLRDDHLLKSDIHDLNSLVNDEIKQMQRALNEISNEPYFIALNLLNFFRGVLRHLPLINRFVSPPSTLEKRLAGWVAGFVSLQRTINGMLTLHHHHHAFVGQRQLINVRRDSPRIIERFFFFSPFVFCWSRHSTIWIPLFRTPPPRRITFVPLRFVPRERKWKTHWKISSRSTRWSGRILAMRRSPPPMPCV